MAHKKKKKFSPETRAAKFMETPMNQFPPALIQYLEYIGRKMGMCGQVCYECILRFCQVIPEEREYTCDVDEIIFNDLKDKFSKKKGKV